MIWQRINAKKHEWLKIYKGILLLEYLMINGSKNIISEVRDDTFEIRMLTNYLCFEDGIEKGRISNFLCCQYLFNSKRKVKEDFVDAAEQGKTGERKKKRW